MKRSNAEKQGGLYVLKCPATGAVRYVGQTTDFNVRRYVYRPRNPMLGLRLREWLCELADQNLKAGFEPLLVTQDQELKDRLERKLIKGYGEQLLNHYKGGRFLPQVKPIMVIEDL